MKMISFKATDKQIATMCALATNASKPVGMGIIHYNPDTAWTEDDFFKLVRGERQWVNLDYIEGRCVKVSLWRGEKRNEWKYAAHEPNANYQTWIDEYPTFPDLMKAAGIE